MSTPAASPGFLFGGDTGISYDALQKRRAVLDAMIARQAGSAPKNVGEGIYSLGQGFANGLEARRLRLAEEGLAKQGEGINADLAGMMAPPEAAQTAGPGSGYGGATGAIADASTPAASGLKPAEAEGYATKYYIDKGLAPYQAAGMVGNLIQESSLNTGARNPGDGSDGSDSIGIMQANGDRARNLMAFAKGTGRDVSNLDTQLDFTLHEMGMGNPEWKKLPGFGAESRAGQMLRSAKDVREATAAGISYERPQGWSAKNPFAGHGWDNRIGHAQRLAGGKWDQAAVAPAQPAPVQVASADPSFMPEAAVQQPQAAVVADLPAAPVPDFLTAGTPATPRPVEMPPGPLPEPGQAPNFPAQAAAPVQTAAVAAPSVAPMPPAQTVAANPVPPGEPAIAMDDPRFDPRTSPEMRQAMISGDFDGLGFKSAQSGEVAGGPPIPAAPMQRVAQAMIDRGITPPAAEASPQVKMVGSAVQEAQARQGQPPQDPRIGMAMRVMQNPAASTEQRAIATTVLQGAMQERRQAEERGYETQQAERNRQNGLADYRTKLELDAQYGAPPSGYRRTGQGSLEPIPGGPQDPSANFKPNLQSVYLDGREQKGYFDAANKWTPVGDPKAPSSGGGVTVLPDGTVQVGGGGVKVPANFMPDPNNPGAVTPIPGGPGEQISGELAARLGLANEFLQKAPELRKHLESGEASGPIDVFQARNNQSSSQASVHRDLEYGVEALVRMLTGAGMNASEADERARRYLPTYTDDASSMTAKLDGLTEYLKATKDAAMLGRGGAPGALGGGQQNGGRQNSGQTDYRSRYGLE